MSLTLKYKTPEIVRIRRTKLGRQDEKFIIIPKVINLSFKNPSERYLSDKNRT